MKRIFFIAFLFSCTGTFSQDIAFGRRIVDTLTSENFWGRGYTKDGMKKAAIFLADEFRSLGVKPLKGKSFFQEFSYPINTFPGRMEFSINGKKLVAGKDFIISNESKGLQASGNLIKKDSITFINIENRFIITLSDKLTWSASQEVSDYTSLEIIKNILNTEPANFSVNIENKFIKKFKASNVCGVVPGTEKPDSFIFITAHYDHLGGMGSDTFFPGANDNASGISLLLNLARYYALHPQKHSIGFICFAGEEAGLVGSKYFTENPLVNLKSIRFLINTDLAGTGEEGITVVNASEFPKEFAIMNTVNDEYHLLTKINSRGKAANSDHYWFTEKGVPAFFFYTLGGIKAYHDVYDRGETLPMTEHEDLFKLIIKFNKKLMATD